MIEKEFVKLRYLYYKYTVIEKDLLFFVVVFVLLHYVAPVCCEKHAINLLEVFYLRFNYGKYF